MPIKTGLNDRSRASRRAPNSVIASASFMPPRDTERGGGRGVPLGADPDERALGGVRLAEAAPGSGRAPLAAAGFGGGAGDFGIGSSWIGSPDLPAFLGVGAFALLGGAVSAVSSSAGCNRAINCDSREPFAALSGAAGGGEAGAV